MSSRQLRRAEARRAAKEASRQIPHNSHAGEPAELAAPAPVPEQNGRRSDHSFDNFLQNAVSLAQLEANRANAWKSTGPRTEAGKRISSMNAVKTGLTGKSVLLPADEAVAYERHVQRFFSDRKPVGERESELVQSLADAQWRLNRIPGLEMGIYALGRLEFADEFSGHDPAQAALLLDACIFMRRQKELKNLALQESRLRRHFQKDAAELADLQEKRISPPVASAEAGEHAIRSTPASPSEPGSGEDFHEIGFVFSPDPVAVLEADPQIDSMANQAVPDLPIPA